jgi:hypothetical protein
MLKKLRIEESQVPRMCLDLYREYGTTMAGLKVSSWVLGVLLFCFVWSGSSSSCVRDFVCCAYAVL